MKKRQKFYAVQRGKKPGVYLTWSECLRQIFNYSGCIHKAFYSYEEAQEFVDEGY